MQWIERLWHVSRENVHKETLIPCLHPYLKQGNQGSFTAVMFTICRRNFTHIGIKTGCYLRTHQFFQNFVYTWEDSNWSIIPLRELVLFFVHRGSVPQSNMIIKENSRNLRLCLHGGRKILEGETTFRLVYMQKFRSVWLQVHGEGKEEKIFGHCSSTPGCRHVCF